MAVGPATKRRELAQMMHMQADGNNTPELLEAVQCGVAFHHAGLHAEERGLVEQVGGFVHFWLSFRIPCLIFLQNTTACATMGCIECCWGVVA